MNWTMEHAENLIRQLGALCRNPTSCAPWAKDGDWYIESRHFKSRNLYNVASRMDGGSWTSHPLAVVPFQGIVAFCRALNMAFLATYIALGSAEAEERLAAPRSASGGPGKDRGGA